MKRCSYRIVRVLHLVWLRIAANSDMCSNRYPLLTERYKLRKCLIRWLYTLPS